MITLEDKIRFTTGDCHILARMLSRQTRWPLFCSTAEDRAAASAAGVTYSHVLVGLPDGRYLDIEGVSTAHEVATRWPHHRGLRSYTEEELTVLWRMAGWQEPWAPIYGETSLTRAEELLPALLCLIRGAAGRLGDRLPCKEEVRGSLPSVPLLRVGGVVSSTAL
jgi:hypothetical protein